MNETMILHPQEKALVLLCRDIGFGRLDVSVQHGLPQHVDEVRKKHNLAQIAKMKDPWVSV